MPGIGEKTIDEAVCHLKQMASEDEELQGLRLQFSDDFLSAFVEGKNGDTNKAFKTLKQYVNIRKYKYREFFKTVVPSKFEYFQKLPKFLGIFKKRDDKGHLLVFYRPSIIDFSVVDIEDVFRAFVIVAEEHFTNEDIAKKGVVGIVDCRGIGMTHVKVATPSRIQFLLNIFMGSYPIKYKGFHVLYDSILVHPILKVIKMLAPQKIRERIYLHGSGEASFKNVIPASVLPKWLGGQLEAEQCYDYNMEERAYSREDHYTKIALNW